MGNKKISSVNGFYVSLSINVVAVLVIFILLLRKRSSSQNKSSAIDTIIQTPSPKRQSINQYTVSHSNDRQQLKVNSILSQKSSTEPSYLKIDKQPSRHRMINLRNSQELYEQIRLLKEELEIERERNQYLQSKQQKLEAILDNTKNYGSKSAQKEVQNLKNELEFCQQILLQVTKSQRQLKRRLEEYERMDHSVFDHPEYQRLKQLNNKYKDIIYRQQNQLLGLYQPNDNYFDISFNN